jgi:membrane protease YdiL (CAAX protease family)
VTAAVAEDRASRIDSDGGANSLWAVRAFVLWASLALLALVPVTLALDAAFPILTVAWIAVPLAVAVRTRDTNRIGFRSVPWQVLAQTTAVNAGLGFAVVLAVEPWAHVYERLLDLALSAEPLDTTFAWLVRYPRLPGLAAMTAYAGFVTMFGEELFFRGWLLQFLRRRTTTSRAIVLQAALFALPNMLVATVMAPGPGILYVVAYAWLAVGVIGGWAAARTDSIWPSLITVTFGNLALVALLT